MVYLIITIICSLIPLFTIYMCVKFLILSYLSKNGWAWCDSLVASMAMLILFVLWSGLYFSPDFDGNKDQVNAYAIWLSGVTLSVICFIVSLTYYTTDYRDDCRELRNEVKEISKMNDIKDWSGVKTNALRHIATYWYFMLIFTPLALGVIVLAWLGITSIGIRVLKYAHAELGAVIIFKDGNISLAGFPAHLLLSSALGCVGGLVSFKIMQWRQKDNKDDNLS